MSGVIFRLRWKHGKTAFCVPVIDPLMLDRCFGVLVSTSSLCGCLFLKLTFYFLSEFNCSVPLSYKSKTFKQLVHIAWTEHCSFAHLCCLLRML